MPLGIESLVNGFVHGISSDCLSRFQSTEELCSIKIKREIYPPENERKCQQLNAAIDALDEMVKRRDAGKARK